jgi:hypothetical protein
MNGAHLRDEGIALGHVADQRLDLLRVVNDVMTEDLRGAGRGFVKPEQSMDESRFAGAVWSQ